MWIIFRDVRDVRSFTATQSFLFFFHCFLFNIIKILLNSFEAYTCLGGVVSSMIDRPSRPIVQMTVPICLLIEKTSPLLSLFLFMNLERRIVVYANEESVNINALLLKFWYGDGRISFTWSWWASWVAKRIPFRDQFAWWKISERGFVSL